MIVLRKFRWDVQSKWMAESSLQQNSVREIRSGHCVVVNVCKVGGNRISLESGSQHLFSCLVLMAERTGKINEYFAFERTAVPMSLFKNGYLRKPDKPSL